MASALVKPYLSPEAYLAWEEQQSERHQYVDGEVFAMAGAQDTHVTVCLNAAVALKQHLAGTPCRTFMADMRLHVQAANAYFYPDVMVTCSAADAADRVHKREPKLVIEVLSAATMGYDRGAKFAAYRRLPSLIEYVLIDTDTRTVDAYVKGADGLWVLHPFGAGQAVRWASVDLEVSAQTLFAELDEPLAKAQPGLA
jgi:Uma2 family endonuclease